MRSTMHAPEHGSVSSSARKGRGKADCRRQSAAADYCTALLRFMKQTWLRIAIYPAAINQ
jgi:hypothetical protein